MPFSQILFRGITTANATRLGLTLYVLLLGTQQGLNTFVGGLISAETLTIQPESISESCVVRETKKVAYRAGADHCFSGPTKA